MYPTNTHANMILKDSNNILPLCFLVSFNISFIFNVEKNIPADTHSINYLKRRQCTGWMGYP
jgi:hypothetical protein